jgi:hypothetical protein
MSRKPDPRLIAAVGAALVSGIHVTTAEAQLKTWIAGSGSWSVSANWSPAGAPPAGANVRIVHNDATNRAITFNSDYPSPLFDLELDNTGTGISTLTMSANRLGTSESFVLARSGRGAFTQTGGTFTVGNSLQMGGTLSTASGTYNMGGGALSADFVDVARSGIARFSQGAGTVNVGSTLIVGGGFAAVSGTGTYVLGGTGQLIAANEQIGANGVGTFIQTGGTNSTGVLNIGIFDSGTYSLSGGTLNVSSALYVGGLNGGAADGTLSISGGVLTLTGTADALIGAEGTQTGYVSHTAGSHVITGGDLRIGVDSFNNNVDGTYLMNGTASLSVNGELAVGYSGRGTFDHRGGTTTADTIIVGRLSGNGSLLLSGGTINCATTLFLGSQLASATADTARLIQSGGTLLTQSTAIGGIDGSESVASFTQSGGLHDVALTLSIRSVDGNFSRYAISNGTVTANAITVDSDGSAAGVFHQTGGFVSSDFDVLIGSSISGTGAYSISAGTLTAGGRVTVGRFGIGSFTHSGAGVVNTDFVDVGRTNSSLVAGSYLMGGGTLNAFGVLVGDPNFGGGAGTFALSAGRVNAGSIDISRNGSLIFGSGTVTSGGVLQNGTLIVTGNSGVRDLALGVHSHNTIAGSLTVSGSMTNLAGAGIADDGFARLTILPGASFTGWGSISPTLVNQGTTTAASGNLTLNGASFSNSGTLITGPGAGMFVNASTSLIHTGTISVGPASVMTFAQPISTIAGRTTTLSGGLLSAPSITVASGATLSGFGQVQGDLVNSGVATFIASSQVIGSLTNNAGAILHVRNDDVIVTGAGVNSGTITTANGTIIFEGGLNLAAPGDGGQMQLGPGGGLLAPFVRQHTLGLNGTPANPGTATIRESQFGGDVSVLNVLSIGGSTGAWAGKLDLSDNDLIVDYTGPSPRATHEDQIRSARNFGTWDGNGITSSVAQANPQQATTLGLLEGFEYQSVHGAGTPFSGQPIDATTVLVKYTWYGDTDFNGFIDGDDYARIDSGFNFGLGGWINGDSDLSGFIDGDDYALIDAAFNVQSGTLRRAQAYLCGDDRGLDGMNTPALVKVREHFASFGVPYAQHFLASVPEPAVIALGGLAIALRFRRPTLRRES